MKFKSPERNQKHAKTRTKRESERQQMLELTVTAMPRAYCPRSELFHRVLLAAMCFWFDCMQRTQSKRIKPTATNPNGDEVLSEQAIVYSYLQFYSCNANKILEKRARVAMPTEKEEASSSKRRRPRRR